jgi:hypothetical protein
VLSIDQPSPIDFTGCLSGASPEVVPALRFLGLKISSDGTISRWKEDFTQATWALWTRL